MRGRVSSSSPRQRAGQVFVWVLAGIAVVVVAATAWIGVRGVLAYGHLQDARSAAEGIRAGLADPVGAATAIDDIAADTSAARSLTDDVVWRAAELLPWVGPQLQAVSTVAAAVDDVASTALQPLAETASSFSIDSIRPVDGVIDVAPLVELQEAADAGASGIAAAATSIDTIDSAALLAPLRAPVDDIRTIISSAAEGADALRRATQLMPPMLGADGPRNYLIVFQNNAEWRSLGGIVGALAMIHTEGGRITLEAQASSTDIGPFLDPVMPLDQAQVALFGTQPARYVQNVTQVPDFTVGAPIAREMWTRYAGVQVDGVIALDPVALSFVLEATGPVSLPSGDVIDSANAVELLLNEVYRRYERPADQDLFFQQAAAGVFAAIASGAADPAALVSGLTRAGVENRLLLWSALPEDQAILDGTTLQGRLPVSDEDTTAFGVYLNDGTASKMDYYMSVSTTVGSCRDTPTAQAGLAVTLRNSAPADAASLPEYITGNGDNAPRGSVETVAYVYLPPGAELVSTETTGDGQSPGIGGGIDGGRQVLSWTTVLAPGQQLTFEVRIATPPTAELRVHVTPTIYSGVTSALAESCEFAQ